MLLDYIKQGQKGHYLGLEFGLEPLNRKLYGVRKGTITTIAAKPKVGKTAFTDDQYIYKLYLNNREAFEQGLIEIHYFSYEISLHVKQAKIMAAYIRDRLGIKEIEHKGEKYQISAPLLLGWIRDKDREVVDLKPIESEILKAYKDIIEPLFGEWKGKKQVKKGYIHFITSRENPTGIRNYLLDIAKDEGEVITEEYIKNGIKKERIVGFQPYNRQRFHLVIIDHLRKVPVERGFSRKENIDKLMEYEVEFRDLYGIFSFINIVHLNDEDTYLIRAAGEFYIPGLENLKDSRNPGEDSDIVIILFNPTDPRYALKRYLGVTLRDLREYVDNIEGNHVHIRVVHIILNRYGDAPVSFYTLFDGPGGTFKYLPPKILFDDLK